MRQVNPSIYTKEYFLHHCSTLDEKGKINKRFRKLFENINIDKNKKILDLGCGRGDLSIFLAKKGSDVIGIDYSKNAIEIANEKLFRENNFKGKLKFYLMDAKKISFEENEFDIVVSIDLFEHLYPEELEVVSKKISYVLKKDGLLLVHTEPNRLYLNFTHNIYIYPISTFLIWLNKFISNKKYPNLPKDPRNNLHKIQHVNEPTFFYLSKTFKKNKFNGKIIPVVPFKPLLSWKDLIYNILVWFYPLSSYWPLHLFFAYDYICIMRNDK